jgi:membrane associated rhomboid family serine protease
MNSSKSATSETVSFVYPIFGVLIIPIVISLIFPSIIDLIFIFIAIAIVFILPGIIFLRIIYEWIVQDEPFIRSFLLHLKPIPPGLVYGTDLKTYKFPFVTTSLICINTVIFFFVPEFLVRLGVFPPYGNPNAWHYALSFFGSTFLHADWSHLFGNMIFLWTFGSAVEPRIGYFKYSLVYLLFIVFSNIFPMFLLSVQSYYLGTNEILEGYHSLGASGAISGVMGIFAVRCYFARVSFSMPIFFLPFFSAPIKIQGILLICLFFAFDLSGSREQFLFNSNIDYWAHVGGYLTGLFVGYYMQLHKAASEESVHVKAQRFSQDPYRRKESRKLYKEFLSENPQDGTALEYLFNSYKAHNQTESEKYFFRLIAILIKRDFKKVIEICSENYPKFINTLSGQSLFSIGQYFYKNTDMVKARFCLELASEKDGPWQAKAMISLSQVFEGIGNAEMARKTLVQLCDQFPETDFQKIATEMIPKLQTG